MTKTRIMALAGALLIGSVAAQATWYTSEASFTSAMSGPFYLEDFTGWTFGSPLDGTQTTWAAPGANGYGWTASAASGLYSNVSALSTNTANDPLVITFSGNPVTAFGGIISNTDITGANIAGNVTFLMSNGDTQTSTFGAGGSGFLGWTGTSAIASVTITATSSATNNWPQIDHVYTGAAPVPEPMTVTGLALGALAMLRRRKKA
jgi:hypothetical protein